MKPRQRPSEKSPPKTRPPLETYRNHTNHNREIVMKDTSNSPPALIKGVFFRPGPTLAAAARDRRFMAALLIVFLVVGFCGWLTAPLQMERSRAMLEQSSLSQYMEGEAGLTAYGWQRVVIAVWVALMSLLAVVIVAFLLYLFYGVTGVEGQYANFFSLTINAALIGTVMPRVLVTAGVLTNQPVLVWISPGGWAKMAGMQGPLASILGQMDLFTLWFILAVALGISAWSGISRNRSLAVAVGYLIFKSVVLGLLGYFGARVMGA